MAMAGKRVRDLQRVAHLVAGALLLAYVYLPIAPDSPVHGGVRWVGLPALVLSGVLMWQWPKLRRVLRARGGP